MNGHDIIHLETVNEFLECQEGKCILCGNIFSHCKGGDPKREIALVCECSFDRIEGIICVLCNGSEVVCTLPQG